METLPQLLNSLVLLAVATAVLLATVTASVVMLAEETRSFFNVFAICITATSFLNLINIYFSINLRLIH